MSAVHAGQAWPTHAPGTNSMRVPQLAWEDCEYLFLDIGANVGDSLAKFYTQPNCYENCQETRSYCRPASETCPLTNGRWMGDCARANETCFCHTMAKQSKCGWEWPWWMTLGARQRYCAEAFEPNPKLARGLQQQAHQLVRRGYAPHIRVRNGTAWSLRDGVADFGIDVNFTTGSSLVLDKRTMGAGGRVGRGPMTGENRVMVRTLDAVAYLRSLTAKHISIKLDVEGSEYTLLRDLLVSGALCEYVDNFWIEWHGGGRVNWRTIGLPVPEDEAMKMYSWMLRTVQGNNIVVPSQLSPHCRTFLGNWA